jgi:DNA-binding IscR family transcriptional regulator
VMREARDAAAAVLERWTLADLSGRWELVDLIA